MLFFFWGGFLQCQKALDPNLTKVLQCQTLLFTALQRVKVLEANLPKVPQCQTLLFTGFCSAKRFWTQTSQKLRYDKHCYLQGSAKIKGSSAKQPKSSTMPNTVTHTVLQCQQGFGPKPPRSSAMPHSVIYRVPQRLRFLAPNNAKVPQC